MKRKGFIVGLAVALLGFGATSSVVAKKSMPVDDVASSVASAELRIEEARVAIESGKQMLATIPEDSPMMSEVVRVVSVASDNWKIAVESLAGSKKSAARISSSSNSSVASDFAMLAKVNANVASSGAQVVKIAVAYVEAVANEETEALELIDSALVKASASAVRVQRSYDRVKAEITKKYSK